MWSNTACGECAYGRSPLGRSMVDHGGTEPGPVDRFWGASFRCCHPEHFERATASIVHVILFPALRSGGEARCSSTLEAITLINPAPSSAFLLVGRCRNSRTISSRIALGIY